MAQDEEKKSMWSRFDVCTKCEQHDSGFPIYHFSGTQTLLHRIYDWNNISKDLMAWCKTVASRAPMIYPALFLSGPQKSGKSAVLNVLLPTILRQFQEHTHSTSVIAVNCDSFEVGNVLRFCDAIEREVRNLGWSVSFSEPNPAKPLLSMDIFFDELGTYLQKQDLLCVILVDEVQRLFLGADAVNTACALKHIFQPNPQTSSDRLRSHFRFALTGSGMVTAFRAFAAMPANGSRFMSDCMIVPITTSAPLFVAKLVDDAIREILPKDIRTDLLMRLPDVPPVLRCFYAELAMRHPDFAVDEIVDRQNRKMFDEFRTDMIPYLHFDRVPYSDQCARRQRIRMMARQECPYHIRPEDVFGDEFTLFKPFLKESAAKSNWGFFHTPFSRFVERVIEPSGTLKTDPTLENIHATFVDEAIAKLLKGTLQVYNHMKLICRHGTEGLKARAFLKKHEAAFKDQTVGLPPICYDVNSKVFQLLRKQNAYANKGQESVNVSEALRQGFPACTFCYLLRCCISHDPRWVITTFAATDLAQWMLSDSMRTLWS